MLAKIVVGLSTDQIKQYLSDQTSLEGPDVLVLGDDQVLKIEQIRAVGPFLAIKPYQGTEKKVVILNAQDLSVVGQNSLLKTIEELSDHHQLWLGTTNLSPLLPTILSRCQVIYLTGQSTTSDHSHIQQLANLSIEDRFQLVEKSTDKLQLLMDLSNYYQARLHNQPKLVDYCQLLLLAQSWFQSNVNQRAVLEYLMLRLPEKVTD